MSEKDKYHAVMDRKPKELTSDTPSQMNNWIGQLTQAYGMLAQEYDDYKADSEAQEEAYIKRIDELQEENQKLRGTLGTAYNDLEEVMDEKQKLVNHHYQKRLEAEQRLKAIREIVAGLEETANTNDLAINDKSYYGDYNFPREVRSDMAKESKTLRGIAKQLLEVVGGDS